MLKSWWTNLQQRCQTCSRVTLGAGLVVLTFVIGAVMLTAGAAGLAWTNTEQFCTGCHEMKDNVYAEFKGTIHDVNRSGVRAICSNCHVPHEPWPLIKRKMRASFELWGHFVGVIDTKEKFQARRYELATRVWTRMKETDSLECRNCHHDNAFDPDKQSDRAKARHSTMKETGLTCIDCHFGIAHHEPDGPGPQELKVAKP
ncbi:MAG: NapC/NirT family cytochrome c [Betaproteobacteria bacterium]|nr:NapC/NirT family cytochrome c [Betaproteobacteria bacterium]